MALEKPAGTLFRNPAVKGVEIHLEEDHLLLLIFFKSRDRWWGKRKVPYLAASVLSRAGLKTKQAQLVDLYELPNMKSARGWEGEGKTGRRVLKPADTSREAVNRRRGCRRCVKPSGDVYKRSGWHQGYQGTGR